MFTIGCHLSSAKGYLKMAQDAASIDGNTFQFFTRNPRGGKAKAKLITRKPIEANTQELEENRRSRSAHLRVLEKL